MKSRVLAQSAVEKIEVEQDQHVSERGCQAVNVVPRRIRVAKLDDVADHEVDLFQATRQRVAKMIRVLLVG